MKNRAVILFPLLALGIFGVFNSTLRVSRDGVGVGIVSCLTVPPGHSSFGITNTTTRQVLYRISRPQFRCDGVWAEFPAPAEAVWMGGGQPLLTIPPETLGAGASSTAAVARPMHITAPDGATAWRIGVVWSYASPTRFQQLKGQAMGFITGRSSRFESGVYTNLSTEVSL
jgi:hypothetical protein